MSNVRRQGWARPHSRSTPHRVPLMVSTSAALLACLALLGASVGGAFRVRQVEVVGAGSSSGAVVRTAGVTGRNIFRVRSDQVVRSLGAMHELDVRRVDVSFPDRVTIYVHMRQRFLAWQDGNALYEVDPDGRVIGQVRTTNLPIITGSPAGQALDPGIVQAVRYAAETLPSAPRGAVATFQLDRSSGLRIVGRAGWTAIVGSGTPSVLVSRIASLKALLGSPQLQEKRLELVDLRSSTPFLRYAGA